MNVAALTVVQVGSQSLDLPTFFPSVSSVKTAFPPLDYVRILMALRPCWSQFLVSAFDLARASEVDRMALEGLLAGASEAGCMVMIDSGHYESHWKESSWRAGEFYQVLAEFKCTFALGFDVMPDGGDATSQVRRVVRQHADDKRHAGTVTIAPVVQGEPNELPSLCAEIAAGTGAPMLAIPERRLGEGIIERALTIRAIRLELEKQGRDVALHLLGTGNPLSIGVFTMEGADSFDGLEWCQTVVDHETGWLHHLSHAQLFQNQTQWGEPGIGFAAWVLPHNLAYMADWIGGLRQARRTGCVKDFLKEHLAPRAVSTLSKALGW